MTWFGRGADPRDKRINSAGPLGAKISPKSLCVFSAFTFVATGPLQGSTHTSVLTMTLRSEGITVAQESKSIRDFMYLYLGGPLFVEKLLVWLK